MSKHATGHWYVALDEDRNAIAVAENGVGPNGGWVGVDIARMALPGKYKTRLQINEHARLIAAAPETSAERDRLKALNAELMETLKAIHAIANTLGRSPNESENALWEIHGKARAAIAKAESLNG